MYKKQTIIQLTVASITILVLNGCVSSTPICDSGASSKRYFCLQGYNFGENLSHYYKLGVKHGCRTANGYFVKDYVLSHSTEAYTQGWEKGRATCKLILPDEAQPGTMRTQYQQSLDEKKYYAR